MIVSMTIDEVIEHCEKTVEFENKYIMKGCRGGGKVEYTKRYLEHKLVKEWLKELKRLRQCINPENENYYFNGFKEGKQVGYNEAIDDFIKKLEEHEHKNWIDNLEYGITWNDIEQIAKELKECTE